MKCDVFISYRRDGGDMTAMYIYQALKERGYDVFYDLEVLRAGKFNDALLENIRACKDFVLILSPHALDRCSDENDWVRKEIAEALRQKKNIVPIMLNGFSFPEKLPDDIDDVRYQNGLTATTEYFMESVNRLCTRYLNSKPKKKGKGLMIAVIAAVLSLAVAAGTILYFTMGPGGAPKTLPTATPTAVPTATPTAEPTAVPTATPTAEPTATPTAEPTATPTAEPTATPTAEPTAVPTPVRLSGTDLPLLREENLLEQYDIAVRYYDNPVFGNEAFRRGQIRSVTFLPTLHNMGENAWDISAAQDGSAMAWTVPNGALYDLYIAGEGGVRLMGNTIFTGYTNAEFIDFNDCVDFSNNTSMRGMFNGCTKLKHLDLSTLDTSRVTDMCDMFDGCYNLVSVNLTGMNTSHVTDMSMMFLACTSLESLDLSGFDTSRVTDMSLMFNSCTSLKELDLSSFDTSRVTTMQDMFHNCQSLAWLDLSSFDMSRVTNTENMLNACPNLPADELLTQLTAPKAELTAAPASAPAVASAPAMLSGTDLPMLRMDRLSSRYIIGGHYEQNPVLDNDAIRRGDIRSVTFLPTLENMGENAWDVSALKNGAIMAWTIPNGDLQDLYIAGEGGVKLNRDCTELFSGYRNMVSIDFNGCVDASEVKSMDSMIEHCNSLRYADLSGLDTSRVETLRCLFYMCPNLESVNLSGLNTSRVTNMSLMFRDCVSLKELDLSGFNTRRVTTMESMFYGCESLRSLDLSGFDTRRVTTMESMFDGCRRLRKLTLPDGFVGPSVENMTHMFTLCAELDQLDVSTWDVSSVKYMMGLFENCHYLLELDVADWNMENVMDTSYMFNECHALDTLDLSRWNTPNNTDMRLMFLGCHSLKELDLSSMNTQNVTTMEGLFESCGDLHTLILPERFVGPSVTSTRAMFNNCPSLKNVDISSWDMSSVTDTNHMFAECHALAALDFSSWDLSRVTESEGMLDGWPNAPESIPGLAH